MRVWILKGGGVETERWGVLSDRWGVEREMKVWKVRGGVVETGCVE